MTDCTSGEAREVCSAGKKSLYWLVYFLAVTILVELSLQLFYRITTGTYLYERDRPPIYAFDAHSGWTNRPNFAYQHVTPEFEAEIYTNGEGFRVSPAREEHTKERLGTSYRILLIGPSFAFGWGVNYEDTFGAYLQHFLRSRHFPHGKLTEVLNHGVPGLPPANELEWLKHSGKEYHPNLVIHFQYGSFEEHARPIEGMRIVNGTLLEHNPSVGNLSWRYAKRSATLFYIGTTIASLWGTLFKDVSGAEIMGAGRKMRNSVEFRLGDSIVQDSLVLYNDLKDTVADLQAELLIVYFPLAYIIHQEDQPRWAFQGVQNVEEQIKSNSQFSSYLNSLGITNMDLTGGFVRTAQEKKRRLYYWLDIHWTPFGNCVAAAAVASYIEAHYQSTLRTSVPGNNDNHASVDQNESLECDSMH